MGSIFLAPHNLGDDETLFGSFLIMRFQPRVVVLFKSSKQAVVGVTDVMREWETHMALSGLTYGNTFEWEQGTIPDSISDAEAIGPLRESLARYAEKFEHAFAPAFEEGGHEQHNLVAEIALEAFGEDRLTRYLTYRRGHARSTSEFEVPFEPDWPAFKLVALGCYVSQIALPATAPWFLDYLDVREYLAHPLTYVPTMPVNVLLDEEHIRRVEML